jgi:hypothetical protein
MGDELIGTGSENGVYHGIMGNDLIGKMVCIMASWGMIFYFRNLKVVRNRH